MPTITIPKTLPRDEKLIVISQKNYEEFLAWQRKVKSARTFKPTARDKKVLARARKNFRQGNYVTLEQLRHELDLNN